MRTGNGKEGGPVDTDIRLRVLGTMWKPISLGWDEEQIRASSAGALESYIGWARVELGWAEERRDERAAYAIGNVVKRLESELKRRTVEASRRFGVMCG